MLKRFPPEPHPFACKGFFPSLKKYSIPSSKTHHTNEKKNNVAGRWPHCCIMLWSAYFVRGSIFREKLAERKPYLAGYLTTFMERLWCHSVTSRWISCPRHILYVPSRASCRCSSTLLTILLKGSKPLSLIWTASLSLVWYVWCDWEDTYLHACWVAPACRFRLLAFWPLV